MYVDHDLIQPAFQAHSTTGFIADVGQEEDFEAAKSKALKIGAKKCVVEDLKKVFVESQCWPAIMCNAHYESVCSYQELLLNLLMCYQIYLLGTSLARPEICRAQIEVAEKEGCFAVSHGW